MERIQVSNILFPNENAMPIQWQPRCEWHPELVLRLELEPLDHLLIELSEDSPRVWAIKITFHFITGQRVGNKKFLQHLALRSVFSLARAICFWIPGHVDSLRRAIDLFLRPPMPALVLQYDLRFQRAWSKFLPQGWWNWFSYIFKMWFQHKSTWPWIGTL